MVVFEIDYWIQLVEKDPERAIPLFWSAINAGDRVDSALKDMAMVMKQQDRAEEAIKAIKSLRVWCSDQAHESLDNILLDLYKVLTLQKKYRTSSIFSLFPYAILEFLLNRCVLFLFTEMWEKDDEIALLKHKFFLIHKGLAFNRQTNQNRWISGEEVSSLF